MSSWLGSTLLKGWDCFKSSKRGPLNGNLRVLGSMVGSRHGTCI